MSTPSDRPLRVLLADDHRMLVEGLRNVLAESGIEVVEIVHDGRAALETLGRTDIDVAVLDVSMPEKSGLRVVEEARAEGCRARFVILTMYDDPAYARQARQLGVDGYLLKESAAEDLVVAVRAVAAGGTYVSAAVVDRVLVKTDATDAELASLTPAERAVLRELAKNRTSQQIARTLGLSVRTVQNHRANMCSKLGLRGANRLLEFALEHRDVL